MIMTDRQRMLHLVLRRKWYDMITSGVKTEEYREIKLYWEKRLLDYKAFCKYYESAEFKKKLLSKELGLYDWNPHIDDPCGTFPKGYTHVKFRLGYHKDAPAMTFKIENITIGYGRPEW